MKQKELKKMNRRELLQVLLEQTKRIETLEGELETMKSRLAEREIRLAESGNIAEAALKLSGVFEAAQEAADLYLENVKCQHAAGAGETKDENV